MKLTRSSKLMLLLPAIVLLSGLTLFLSLPRILIGAAEETKVDVILELELRSERPNDDYVAELYRRGIAKNIMCLSEQLTCGVFGADLSRQALIDSGVPAGQVYSIHLPVTDCPAQAAPMIIQQIQSHGWRSALIVTHPVASKMIRRTYDESFKSGMVSLFVGYSRDDAAPFSGMWWKSHKPTQQLVRESMESILDQLYPACR